MWLALALSAHAAPTCDAKALAKALTDAGPQAAGKAYADLAACDAAAAKTAAPEAFKKVLAGPNGDLAVVAALQVGAGQVVRDWMTGLQPDERPTTINKLGQTCNVKEVPPFFVETEKQLGAKFWSERWYAGLDECRDPAVQELLKANLGRAGTDRTLFFGILEAWAKNLGKAAVPELAGLLKDQKDPEIATYIVNAFASAALGDAEATKQAIAAIKEAAPTLPEKAVEQARTTLLALDAEADADRLAAVRYKDRLQGNGGLLYGVVVTEVATCKKGDVKVELHHAPIHETGHTWPDQVNERVTPVVQSQLELDLADSCKGTGTTATLTSQPLKDMTAYEVWVQEQVTAAGKANAGVKVKVSAEDPLSL
ncbi:MAG: hypothetical protein ACOZNI_09980 [Myxococcota bacterium]